MSKQQFKKKSRRKKTTPDQQPMLFDATNYKLMGLGAALILIGFLIMYLESEVRGFWSLYVSPIVVLAGFGTVAFSIMKKRSDIDDEHERSPAPHSKDTSSAPGISASSGKTVSGPASSRD